MLQSEYFSINIFTLNLQSKNSLWFLLRAYRKPLLNSSFFLTERLGARKNCIPIAIGFGTCSGHIFTTLRSVFFKNRKSSSFPSAQMAKLVDALVSGTSVRKDVQVRPLFWVQIQKPLIFRGFCCFTQTKLSTIITLCILWSSTNYLSRQIGFLRCSIIYLFILVIIIVCD